MLKEKVQNHTDFINNVGKIVSALYKVGVESVAYYEEMDVKSRDEKWRNVEVDIVATSAFRMGVDKSDIKHIV